MVFVEKSFLLSKRETKAETKIFITKQLIMTAPSVVKTPTQLTLVYPLRAAKYLLVVVVDPI